MGYQALKRLAWRFYVASHSLPLLTVRPDAKLAGFNIHIVPPNGIEPLANSDLDEHPSPVVVMSEDAIPAPE